MFETLLAATDGSRAAEKPAACVLGPVGRNLVHDPHWPVTAVR